MSQLSAFLHPVSLGEEREVVISSRFQDGEGNSVPFRIRPVTQWENDAITRLSRRTQKVNGILQDYLDTVEYNRRLVVVATIIPDFQNKELCQQYGTLDPLELPAKMLLSGEFRKLITEILDVSGFSNENPTQEAKN